MHEAQEPDHRAWRGHGTPSRERLVAWVKRFAPNGRVFVVNETDEPKPLLHQEHGKTIFAPGVPYEFGQVREKDWFTEMVAPVRD